MSGQVFIQPPAHLPFRNHIDEVDDPLGEFKDNEVKGMNDDYRKEQAFWMQEHSH